MQRKNFHFNMAAAAATMVPVMLWLAIHSTRVGADEASQSDSTADTTNDNAAKSTDVAVAPAPTKPAPAPKLPEPKGAKRLARNYDAWIDPKNKAVIVDGQISLREGMLEMFACTRNTKEHESIVSVNSKAFLVHAALLSLGAEPGRPVQFVPKYRPPTGTEIEVTVEWLDKNGKQMRARAQDWIKDINTKKPMTHPFVFAGSWFLTDEETGKKFYEAERGDLICVSNFSTAMLDIPVESSPENSDLAFEAFTKRIPPLGAPVRLILKPKLKKQGAGSKEQGTEAQEEDNRVGDAKAAKSEANAAKDETQ